MFLSLRHVVCVVLCCVVLPVFVLYSCRKCSVFVALRQVVLSVLALHCIVLVPLYCGYVAGCVSYCFVSYCMVLCYVVLVESVS